MQNNILAYMVGMNHHNTLTKTMQQINEHFHFAALASYATRCADIYTLIDVVSNKYIVHVLQH